MKEIEREKTLSGTDRFIVHTGPGRQTVKGVKENLSKDAARRNPRDPYEKYKRYKTESERQRQPEADT